MLGDRFSELSPGGVGGVGCEQNTLYSCVESLKKKIIISLNIFI